MSDSESFGRHASEDSVSLSGSDYVLPRMESPAPEREGLPQSYRMRADAHYVDQLESPTPPVIRLLAAAQIQCGDLPPAERVDALIRSIRTHGVLQPLLIRRAGGRYTLIAGRKRLAAAIAAGLTVVPCVLHDIEAAAVTAVAEAENLRVDAGSARGTTGHEASAPVMRALAADLATIRTSLPLLRGRSQGALAQRVATDLIEAQAAHADWIISCVTAPFESSRPAALAAIVQRVADTFAAYTTLTGLQLECTVSPAAALWKLPEEATSAVLKGAVFATLALLEGGATAPRIELHADATVRGALKVEVVQRSAGVPARAGEQPESDGGRPGDAIVNLALRTARAVAALHGGTADLTALPGTGSALQITFAIPSPTSSF